MQSIKFVFVIFLIYCCDNINAKKDWWEVSALYQIYPRSFKDSDGDGIGDLKGITEKLSYLKEIGINATWLSPIYKSPMTDFGYDISNYFEIQPEYGTMDDFDDMIKKANELGIKIVMDFVPNHTSDEHEWFLRSADNDPLYKDFYVWHPGHFDPNNSSNRLPPNNWICNFRGSAWEWNENRQQFYLHQFSIKQPDLNYRNPIVVEVMKSVLRFWLDRGVVGFRVDAIPGLFEVLPDENGNYPDEPKSGLTDDPYDSRYLLHIYTTDLNETLDMVYQWRKLLDDYRLENGGDTRIMMTESNSRMEIIQKYFNDDNGRDGSHIPFNFQFFNFVTNESNAVVYKEAIDLWLKYVPVGQTSNWVIGNHDQRRVSSRLGENRTDAITMIIQTLPGISVTYYGEEIGMTDLWLSWDDTIDPLACSSNPEIYDTISRDPARTPFQWDSSTNAGFSTGNTTWLPVSPSYKTINVEAQNMSNRSHLKIYKDLARLRQTETFKDGKAEIITLNENVLGILRASESHDKFYVTVANMNNKTEKVNLKIFHFKLSSQLSYVVLSLFSNHQKGEAVQIDSVSLQPFESFVLEGCKVMD